MSSLIVALNPSSSRAAVDYSYALTADGQSLVTHGSVTAKLLPNSTELVAIVPSRMVSWHRLTIPKVPAARLSDVLHGMLEEQLLDDPQNLHLALQPGGRSALGSGTPVWVAACDKAWLRSALQGLEAAGRRVSRVVPELVPDAGQTWVYGSPQSAWCAQSDAAGVSVLPLSACQGLSMGEVFAEPAVAAMAEQTLGVKVTIRQSAQQLLAAARSDWNLAQFDLASAGRKSPAEKLLLGWQSFALGPQWRAVRWGLVVLLLIQFGAISVSAWKEKSALVAKRNQLRQLFVQSYPQSTVVIDPVAQMTKELALQQQAAGQLTYRDLEVMLSYLAVVLPQGQNMAGLEFKPGEVKIKGAKLSSQELTAMETRLKEAGYFAFSQADSLVLTYNPNRIRQ